MVEGEGGGRAGRAPCGVVGRVAAGGSKCVAGAPTVSWSDPVRRGAGEARV